MATSIVAGLVITVGVFVLGWHAGARSHGHLAIGSALIGLVVFLGVSAFALLTMPAVSLRSTPQPAPSGPSLARDIGDAAAKATKGMLEVGGAFVDGLRRNDDPPPKPIRERR